MNKWAILNNKVKINILTKDQMGSNREAIQINTHNKALFNNKNPNPNNPMKSNYHKNMYPNRSDQ